MRVPLYDIVMMEILKMKMPLQGKSCGGFVFGTDMRSISLFCQVRKGGIEICL